MPTLYYSINLNPRLCVAAARFLQAPIRYEEAAPLAPGQAERFAPLNPNLRVPILQMDDGSTLWECDAIVCKLARLAGKPEFFPDGEQLPELIRWLSWTAKHWGRATSAFYFQHIVVPRYRLPVVPEAEMQGYAGEVARLAPILDAHLAGRTWVLGGDTPTYADFRVGDIFPFEQDAQLDFSAFPNIRRLSEQLNALPGWAAPFEGLPSAV